MAGTQAIDGDWTIDSLTTVPNSELRRVASPTGCAVIARTPDDASYFFGFHDISPWSADGRYLLMHRFDGELAGLPDGSDEAEIVIWDRSSGEFRVVGRTTTWNLQQGARAMWLPGPGRQVAYNRLVDGGAGCEIVDIDSGARRTFGTTIGAVSPDGRYALTPSYGRLARYWKAYGYQALPPPPGLDAPGPAEDGIWRLDLATGEHRLIVPISELPRGDARDGAGEPYRFVTHLSFNPAGTRIVFYDRSITRDGALYSRFLSATPEGTGLRVIADEKVSHFCWLDEKTLLVWMRRSLLPITRIRSAGLLSNPLVKPLLAFVRSLKGRFKSSMLRESFYELDVDGAAAPHPFEPALFSQDGHPMLSPDGRYIVIDAYPDGRGRIPLAIYDRLARRRVDIADFQHGVVVTDSDLKCDFHPRWNRDGTQICGDVCTMGRRSVVILDVRPALAP
ncbi:MAG: hypothetical protein WDN03_14175 [Rhizomicrobium sp.]